MLHGTSVNEHLSSMDTSMQRTGGPDSAACYKWSEFTLQNLRICFLFLFFRFTCRGLFERHKLLFSFQMCAKILEAAGKLNMDEYNFFLRGGVVSSQKIHYI